MEEEISFPDLPVELVRAIFETSATSHKPSALALVSVSRIVKHWIEPILYATVALPSQRRFKAFSEIAQLDSKQEAIDRVQALHIPVENPQAVDLLKRCTKIQHLAINSVHLAAKDSYLSSARPRRLVLFGFLSSPHPLFTHVTHLSVFSVPLDISIPPYLFPALTHLMGVYILDNTPPTSFLRNLRRTIRRAPAYPEEEDAERRFPPLKLMVLNICNAPARPDYDRALEVWKYEEELIAENVLMRPSERLTLTEWEDEASSGGVNDRWTRLELQLQQRMYEIEQRRREQQMATMYMPLPWYAMSGGFIFHDVDMDIDPDTIMDEHLANGNGNDGATMDLDADVNIEISSSSTHLHQPPPHELADRPSSTNTTLKASRIPKRSLPPSSGSMSSSSIPILSNA